MIVGGLFLIQEIQLLSLQHQWNRMSAKVADLQAVQARIHQYSPWFDGSFRDLAIMRQLSLAFPQDGSVTAKTIDIQPDNTVTCSGNARDNAALREVLGNLGKADGVSALNLDLMHGKTPMQFTFHFQYGTGGAQ